MLHLTNTDASATRALDEGRIVFLDAQTALDDILVDDTPDSDRFQAVIGTAVRQAVALSGQRGVRAYGEMVGLLWTTGQLAAAIQLEACWNELLQAESCSLFCGYPLDVFGPEFQQAEVDAVLCAHTHLVPADRAVEAGLDAAIGEVLGPQADSVRLLLRSALSSWETLPKVEVTARWLHRNLPDRAAAILDRARVHATSSSSPGLAGERTA